MKDSVPPKAKSFTVFRSAAEEDATRQEHQNWDNEGGHMSSTSGRVTRGTGTLPYVAILTHHGSEATEHAFATMREAEAFIRRNTPAPDAKLSDLYDRSAADS